MNKKIFFPIAIIIILVCAIFVASLAVWQYLGVLKEEEISEKIIPTEAYIRKEASEEVIPATPYIKVISPNGGEILNTGQQFEIRWEAANISSLDTFTISLVREDHATGQIIKGFPSTQRSYLWTVKVPPLGFGYLPGNFTLAVAGSEGLWSQDRRYKILISTVSTRDSSDNYFSIIDPYIDLKIDLKKFLMKLDGVSEDQSPFQGLYEVIINDFDKDGINEIVTAIWYGRPGGTVLRLIRKEDEEYRILSRDVTLGGISYMEIKDIPLGYQSVVTTESACFGSGMGCTVETIYTYINGKLQKTWSGLTRYYEEGWSRKIENLYNIKFQDIDNDGNPEIIHSGKERFEQYNEQTDNWDTISEELIEEVYKWNEGTKQYEKI